MTPREKSQAKALAALGGDAELFSLVQTVAREGFLRGLAKWGNDRAEAQEATAIQVGEAIERARALIGQKAGPEWTDTDRLLAEALREVHRIAGATAEWKERQPLTRYLPGKREAGRPSLRSWFMAAVRDRHLAKYPVIAGLDAGDWAHLGRAVNLESEPCDFENIRKSYADLLAARAKPGKPGPRRKSRAR